MTGWFAAAGRIVGNAASWTTHYHWDHRVFLTREQAISHGFETFGSDDFNVGRVRDGVLVWWGWMSERHPEEDYPAVAAALYLRTRSAS